MRSLLEDTRAVVDLSVVLMIGIAFVALTIIAYLIYTLKGQLILGLPTGNETTNPTGWTDYYSENATRASIGNITAGFDDAVSLLLVAITIFILAIAISALLMLRGR